MSELKIALALAAFIFLVGAGISLHNRRGWLHWLPNASLSLWLFSLLFRL